MSVEVRLTNREIYETGAEPEYVATELVKYEQVGRDMVRLYVASERGAMLRMEYTVLVTIADLIGMAASASFIIASLHGPDQAPPIERLAH